ncbi:MAG: RHS repeat-associated core domain-containing protein, partial [Vicinamibacteria bacterium]
MTGTRDVFPELGAWAQRDPLGLHDGSNLYTYAATNPMSRIDPEGTCSRPTLEEWVYELMVEAEATCSCKCILTAMFPEAKKFTLVVN